MKFAKNPSKIDKSHPLSVGIAAMHSTQLHHLITRFYKSLLLKSWDTAVNTNISHCCDRTTKVFFPSVGNRTVCLLSVLQKSNFWVLQCSSVYKNVSSNFALPKCLLFIYGNRAENTNTALSISIKPLNKAVLAWAA